MPPDFISVTQISMYLRCPLQYYYRYCRGLKVQPTGTLIFGSSIHSTLELNYKQKILTHEDLKIPELQDFFAERFDTLTDQFDWADPQPKGELKDSGVENIRQYHKIISPYIQPINVEQVWTLEIDGMPKKLKVIVDLIDDKRNIIDNKTSGRHPNPMLVKSSLQLTIYALGYRLATGYKENSVGLDYLIHSSDSVAKPTLKRFKTVKEDFEIQRAVKTIKEISNAIQQEIFYPCNPENWWCSEKWCGYYNLCQKEWQ